MSNAQNYPQVHEFLRQCDLLEYYDRFISEGFDQMRSLFDITEMDLIAMNVKRGHRRRIQREIATMKGIPTSQPLHIQSEPGLGPIGDYSSSSASTSTILSTPMTNPGKNIIPTTAAAPGSSIPVLIDGANGGRSRGFDYNNNYGYNNNVGESCARHQPPNLLPPLNHTQPSFYNNNNESSFQRQIAISLSKPSTMTINQPSRNIAATAAKFNSNNDQSSSSYPLPNKTNLNLTLRNPNDPNNNEDVNNNNGKRKYKRHPKRDKNAPVKPLSAYVMFSHKVREEYQGKNVSFPDMAKIVGDRWKSIPAEEKEMIENEAAKAKEEYLAAMTVYKTTDKWKQYQEYLRDFKEKHDPNYRESNKGRKRSKFDVNSPDSDQTTNSGYSSTRSTSLGYVSSGSSNNGKSNGAHNGNNGNDGSSNQNNNNIRNIRNIHNNNNDINNSNKNYTSVATTNSPSSLPSSSKNNNKNSNDNNNDNNNNNNNYIPPYAHSNPTMPFYNHRNNKNTGSSTTTTSTFANISSNSNASSSTSTNNSSTSLSPNINNTSLSGLLIHPKDCYKQKSDDNNNSNCDGDNSDNNDRHSISISNNISISNSISDSDNGNDNDNQIFEDFNTNSSPNNESFDGGNNNQNQHFLIDQEEEQQQQQQQQQPSSTSCSISPSSSFSSSFSSSQ